MPLSRSPDRSQREGSAIGRQNTRKPRELNRGRKLIDVVLDSAESSSLNKTGDENHSKLEKDELGVTASQSHEKWQDRVNEEELCKICHEQVCEQDRGLCCDLCNYWFHGNCINMKNKEYEMLKAIDEKVSWYCCHCETKSKTLQEENRVLQTVNETMKREITNLKDAVWQMQQQIKEFRRADILENIKKSVKIEVDDLRKAVNNNVKNYVNAEINKYSEKINKNSQQIAEMKSHNGKTDTKMKEINEGQLEEIKAEVISRGVEEVERRKNQEIKNMKEIQSRINELEKEKRRKNLVIYNIRESEEEDTGKRYGEDEEKCRRLITGELGVDTTGLKQLIRLGGKQNNKPRPLLIKFTEEDKPTQILKEAKRLRYSKTFVRVYIARDLTKAEREKEKSLREEIKEKRNEGNDWYTIRNGRIIKQKKKDQDERDVPESERS